jgi:hypothetical protein
MARDRIIRLAGGSLLAVATLISRVAIHAKTFFEFDSINFAVATFRFDVREVTPQIPGYILHVLFGRLLYWIIGDLNLAYVWVSILLSIGSVLFLWRAAAELRGERVAIVAALLWLTTPLFWFHGAVAAIYAEEAFFTATLLYCGLRWINNPKGFWRPTLFLVFLSLATAARQTSILFWLPATIYLFIKLHPRRLPRRIAYACLALLTLLWVIILLIESGGPATYLSSAWTDNNFRTQSILFGHSWRSQLDTIAKVLFYLPVALGACTLALIIIFAILPRRVTRFIRAHFRNRKAQFVFLAAIPALIFYMLVFFMKAGYLLNVVPSFILVAAVLIDQAAIWLAQFEKRNPDKRMRLTRPIITRNVAILTGLTVAVNILWFLGTWPGTKQSFYDNENTRNSFIHGAVNRYEHSSERYLTLANRAWEYTNISGIRAVDSLNTATQHTLETNGAANVDQVILASWWYRWAYLEFPHAVTYDLELDPYRSGALWVGRSHELHRDFLRDSVIGFVSPRPVLLLLRHDRPDFTEITQQVHLERLPMPEYLDLYKILDSSFTLKWHDRTFIGRVNGSQQPTR